jgi:hypothetical protein
MTETANDAMQVAAGLGFSRVMFSSATGKWSTPLGLYAELDAEFRFTLGQQHTRHTQPPRLDCDGSDSQSAGEVLP